MNEPLINFEFAYEQSMFPTRKLFEAWLLEVGIPSVHVGGQRFLHSDKFEALIDGRTAEQSRFSSEILRAFLRENAG